MVEGAKMVVGKILDTGSIQVHDILLLRFVALGDTSETVPDESLEIAEAPAVIVVYAVLVEYIVVY